MGLFDFLFGSDESSTKQWGPRKFLIFGERRNGGKLNERSKFFFASPFRRLGLLAKTGTVATMTTMACRDLIRMRIMIFNASASIIFGTTFGTIFARRNFFQKNDTQAETLVIQIFPRIVYTISRSKTANLRRKTPSAPKIFTPLL